MTTLNVQFQDSSNEVITSYFANPQDVSVFPNQGTVDTSDARYATFFEQLPPAMRAGLPAPE